MTALFSTPADFTEATKANASEIPAGADSWLKTIKNAWKGAQADGADRYVGTTYTSYFIITAGDLDYQPGVQLRVTAGGHVFKKNA